MVKSRDFNCEGDKRDEKTFDTKADGSVFTSAKEKPPIPKAEPPIFTLGWFLMKPQTSPKKRIKKSTILNPMKTPNEKTLAYRNDNPSNLNASFRKKPNAALTITNARDRKGIQKPIITR